MNPGVNEKKKENNTISVLLYGVDVLFGPEDDVGLGFLPKSEAEPHFPLLSSSNHYNLV